MPFSLLESYQSKNKLVKIKTIFQAIYYCYTSNNKLVSVFLIVPWYIGYKDKIDYIDGKTVKSEDSRAMVPFIQSVIEVSFLQRQVMLMYLCLHRLLHEKPWWNSYISVQQVKCYNLPSIFQAVTKHTWKMRSQNRELDYLNLNIHITVYRHFLQPR